MGNGVIKDYTIIRTKRGIEIAITRFILKGDIVLHRDLTWPQACQTKYAYRDYADEAFMLPPYRFDYAEPYFAWHPVRYYLTGEWVWWKEVTIVHLRKGYGDCTEYEVVYVPLGEPDTLPELLLTKTIPT
jgi:hypothetical protein